MTEPIDRIYEHISALSELNRWQERLIAECLADFQILIKEDQALQPPNSPQTAEKKKPSRKRGPRRPQR